MRIPILGGTRFFGPPLVYPLVEEGHQAVMRGRASVTLPSPVKRPVGGRRRAAALREAVGARTWEVVIDDIGFTAKESRLAIEVFAEQFTPMRLLPLCGKMGTIRAP